MTAERCGSETAGYDGMFGVHCDRPKGHKGDHIYRWENWEEIERVKSEERKRRREAKARGDARQVLDHIDGLLSG